MSQHTLPDNLASSVSFTFDGQHYDTKTLRFQKCETGAIWEHQSGLQLTVQRREFEAYGAAEWMLEFSNTGESELPLLEQVCALDIVWQGNPTTQYTIHGNNGSCCVMDDFLPFSESLQTQQCTFAPIGGRSSDGAFPFWNFQSENGGLILALGWSGQWSATFQRTDEGLHLQAGQETLRVKLLPGETIRSPRVLLLQWDGQDASVGDNALRRLLLNEYCQREADGEIALPPISHMTMSQYHHSGWTSEEYEINALQRAHDLGCNAFWVDACWYGQTGKWFENVGDWSVKTETFPNGLKPIGDAAKAHDMKFILWFEPERVVKTTPLASEHPEWLLHSPNDNFSALFNLGIPAARQYMTDVISNIIAEAGVTIYRQDFNFEPLPFWQAADQENRQGMTELRHIEGLYAMWDELKRRHPGLLIDNCASGGRRLDLETTMRSFPLWRSDFSDIGGPEYGALLQMGDQSQAAGLSRRLPLHSASVWTFSPYAFRSAMSAGICLYCGIQDDDFPSADARAAIAELKRLRPYFTGDFYDLAPLTLCDHDWCAYQLHRDDLRAGFALFLRRHASPFVVMESALHGVQPRVSYKVCFSLGFEQGKLQVMMGEELLKLKIELEEMPSAMLVEYSRCE